MIADINKYHDNTFKYDEPWKFIAQEFDKEHLTREDELELLAYWNSIHQTKH